MNKLKYIKSLFVFAFANNRDLYLAFVLAIGSNFLEIAAITCLLPLLQLAQDGQLPHGSIIVTVLERLGLRPDSHMLLLVFLAIFALRILTQIASQGLSVSLSRRVQMQLTTRAFAALIHKVPVRELEARSVGYYISMAGDEAARASNIVMTGITLTTTVVLSALYYAAIVMYSPPAGVFVAVFLIVTFLALLKSFSASQKLGFRQIEQSQSATSFFIDAVNSLRVVRSFSAETYVSELYTSQIKAYTRTLIWIDIISIVGRLAPALLLIGLLAAIVSFDWVTKSISIALPALITLLVMMLRFFPIVGQSLNLMLRVVADTRAGKDVTQLINTYEQLPARAARPSQKPLTPIRRIDINGLAFTHASGRRVLRRLNVSLRAGKSYALVGSSGSGKSTLLDLLLGFHEAERGQIQLNGQSLADVGVAEVRRRIILVSQETAIFNDTVLNNLQLGVVASHSAIEAAASVACIDELVHELPKQYDTLLAYRGTNLSGGQRQRLGIARAVLRSPDVILFDESTSALDGDTREKVVANLKREFAERILVFVTHDSYVKSQVDEVLDMSELDPAPLPAREAGDAMP